MKRLLFNLRESFSQNYFGYLLESYHFFRDKFSSVKKPEKKFVIFGKGRSGSTLLVSLLNSNPDVFCDGEILNRKMSNPIGHLHRMARRESHPIYGFKLLSYQVMFTHTNIKDKHGFMEKLHNDGFHIIYLRRDNILRYALSILYARFRMQWHHEKGSGEIKREKMTVDIKELFRLMEDSIRDEKFERDVLSGLPHEEVVYERDLEDNTRHADTVKRLCSFLGIRYTEPETNLMKITTKDLDGFIENADELRESLQGTPFEKYLDPIEYAPIGAGR